MAQRILIVEHDDSLALEMAAVLHADGYSTSILPTAADAFRALEERRPELILVRAELPEQNGFSLCARIRRTKPLRSLPVILLSSDSSPEALAQHAAHPSFAANAYLAVPFAMDELRARVRSLLGSPAPGAVVPEGTSGTGDEPPAEEGVLELVELVDEVPPARPEPAAAPDESIGIDLDEALAEEEPAAGEGLELAEAAFPTPGKRAPPKLPKRERRGAITEEDKAFLDRVFGAVADRKGELLAEAKDGGRRAKVRRELLNTPEGKLQLLREELRSKEAQIARLSEIWAIREHDLHQSDDRLHEKEVEVQSLKMQVDDLNTNLTEARALYLRKQREHGESVDQLLLQQNLQEKELIEVVAGKEREINLLRGEVYRGEDELAARAKEIEGLRAELAERTAERDEALQAGIGREAALLRALAGRDVSIAWGDRLLQDAREERERLGHERDERLIRQGAAARLRVEQLGAALAAKAWETRELEAALEGLRQRQQAAEQLLASERQEREAAEAALEELLLEREIELFEEELARGATRVQRDGIAQSLGDRLADRDLRVQRLEEELAAREASAQERETELGTELAARIEQIGNLEGELEDERAGRFEVEAELRAELDARGSRLGELEEKLAAADAALAALHEGLAGKSDELASTQGQLAAARESLAATEARLEQAIAELTQAADAAMERERSWEAALAGLRSQLEEREHQLGSAQALLAEARDALDAQARQAEAKAAEWREVQRAAAEREALMQAELGGALERAAGLEQEVAELGEELSSVRAAMGDREAQVSVELATLRGRASGLEAELQTTRDELAVKEERWQEDLQQRSETILDLQGKLEALQAERKRATEEAERSLVSRTEALRVAEQELASTRDAIEALERTSAEMIATHRSRAGELELELEGARAESARLAAKLAETEAQRQQAAEASRTSAAELAARLQALEVEVLSAKELAGERGEALRSLQEATRIAERDAAAALAQAEARFEEQARALREMEKTAQLRARRAQELEAAVESASSSRTRLEREHQAKLEEQQAKASELKDKLNAMLRERREAEARSARELELLGTRQKAELQRREQQRALEVGRLQTALQEKTKALKVAELELARIKARLARAEPAAAAPRGEVNTVKRAEIGAIDLPTEKKVEPDGDAEIDLDLERS